MIGWDYANIQAGRLPQFYAHLASEYSQESWDELTHAAQVLAFKDQIK